MAVRAALWLWLSIVVGAAMCGTLDEWRSRSIYQLLTDRFATGDGSAPACADLKQYCGGKWAGIAQHIDYIKGMGFDAVWISPVVKNTPLGYHGFWTQDWFSVNPFFGTQEDLIDFIEACHEKDVWVMIDVVANHAGPVDYNYTTIYPFNDTVYYHDCVGCDSECWIADFDDQYQMEHCRLYGLPDLNQSIPYVRQTLVDWISYLVELTGADGIRVDTVPHIEKSFWSEFNPSAGVFQFGEVYNTDPAFLASYQPPFDSVLSYPMFFTLRDVFCSAESMTSIHDMLLEYIDTFSNLAILGNFIDNHDQVRFLCCNPDVTLYKNALTLTLMNEGIPILYYGSEQGYDGCADPECREPLWWSGYDTSTELYQFIKTIISFRKENQLWDADMVERASETNFYAFTRGEVLIAVTNGGSSQGNLQYTVSNHPYEFGTELCNLFDPEDCVVVDVCASESTSLCFDIELTNGEPKVLYPNHPSSSSIITPIVVTSVICYCVLLILLVL
ncbi:acidstable alpha-amylase [Pelomyxa schiedti]|nr:acidstable alpha-amylase [Pelomyxa schiedti]